MKTKCYLYYFLFNFYPKNEADHIDNKKLFVHCARAFHLGFLVRTTHSVRAKKAPNTKMKNEETAQFWVLVFATKSGS